MGLDLVLGFLGLDLVGVGLDLIYSAKEEGERKVKPLTWKKMTTGMNFFIYLFYFGGWGLRLWLVVVVVALGGDGSCSGFVGSERDVNENKK